MPLVMAALVLVTAAACRRRGESAPSAEAIVRERRLHALTSLVGSAAGGPLVRFDSVLVVVDGSFIQDLLSSVLPFERVVQGRYRVRITGAKVSFEDGFALIQLDGRASLASGPEERAFADVTVYGTLDVVDIDPASGVLRGRVELLAVDARRVAVLGVSAPSEAEKLVEDLGRQKLASFAVLASGIEIPVHLESAVRIPGVGPQGGVRIEEARVPLRLAVTDVRALRGKLWISIEAGPEPAPAAAAESPHSSPGGASAPPRAAPAPTAGLDELRRRLAGRLASDPVVPGVMGSTASDVLVGIRGGLIQDLLREAAARYLDRVDLDLDLDAHVDESRPVEIDTLLGHIQAGTWRLRLDIHRVRGTLRSATTPRLTAAGTNRVHMDLPVMLDRAEGWADVRFAWDARALANVVCRDFEVSKRLRGRVLPESYDISGDFVLSAGPTALLARPVFPNRRYRIHIDLAPESWREVRGALEEQDRLLRCGIALDPDQILPKLRELLQRGFEVALPRELFRALELPASLRQSVSIEERQVDLSVSTTDLRVTPTALWYGAAVRTRVGATPAAAASPQR